jgi:type II secretory ATPase GspE/PulE/Tfp pilus assembly ATPase PilB-like protein
LHCADTVSVFLRLEELGIARPLAANAVLGVVAQRLLRRNCPVCMEPESLQSIYLERLAIPEQHRARLLASRGCSACEFKGTQGRIGVYELLEMRGPVRVSCAAGDDAALRLAARNLGLVPLQEQASGLAMQGVISAKEAYRASQTGGEW